MIEINTLPDVLRIIKPRYEQIDLYFKPDTNEVLPITTIYDEYFKEHPDDDRIPYIEKLKVYHLPDYESINHKEIMSFYVRECIYDKAMRKELFDILRYRNYMDKFYDALNKYDLYDEHKEVTDFYYEAIIEEWLKENNIVLKNNK